MTQENTNPAHGPSPEELAAYVDGELEGAARDRVESWLLDHPDAAAEADRLQRLARLWEAVTPPEPSPSAWATALRRIEAALPIPVAVRAPAPRRPVRQAVAVLAAAAVVAAVLLSRSLWPPAPPRPAPESDTELVTVPDEEPFPVARAEDVNVLSVEAHEADSLLVGHPPLLGAVEFAAPEDIRLIKTEAAPEGGAVPRLEEGAVPMIVGSLASAQNPEP